MNNVLLVTYLADFLLLNNKKVEFLSTFSTYERDAALITHLLLASQSLNVNFAYIEIRA